MAWWHRGAIPPLPNPPERPVKKVKPVPVKAKPVKKQAPKKEGK